VSVNPIINWQRIIRINLTRRVREWLTDAELAVTAIGTPASKGGNSTVRTSSTGSKETKDGIPDDLLLRGELEEAKQNMEKQTLMHSQLEVEYATLGDKIEEAKGLGEREKVIKQDIKDAKAKQKQALALQEQLEEALKQGEEAKKEALALVEETSLELHEQNETKAKANEKIHSKLREANAKSQEASKRLKKAKIRAEAADKEIEKADKFAREAISRELQAKADEKLLLSELERLQARIAELESQKKASKTCVLI